MHPKILLVVIAVLPASFSKTTEEIFGGWKRRLENEHPECQEMTDVTQREVDAHFLRLEMSPTASFKCFIHCGFKAFKLINKDGSLNRDEFLKDIERATTEMMDDCDGRIAQIEDQCEKTFKLSECVTHYRHVYI
ncbi:hypothetical protein PPYR_13911 [Photinus pyralis]|uniref:Uncharacterized protein n=2 Tax=Photinus pyralis TaxID=7054 RepID=A0A5N4A3Q0_PHOPY|nr:uncharacterized protein LOC116181204 [Photinus pyralis]KAB0791950.1 hypothetical protein PPYR_13911 [Photinus pyralis]